MDAWITDPSITCRPAEIRGRLAHSHLKNTYLALGRERLAKHLADSSLNFQDETRQLVEELERSVTDYSPARLVEMLEPLTKLSDEPRAGLRTWLDREFVNRFRPDETAREIRERGLRFLESVDGLQSAWRAADRAESCSQAHRAMVAEARDLLNLLDNLPRGIWLP